MALRVLYNEAETGQTKALGGVERVEYITGKFKVTYVDGGGPVWLTKQEFEGVEEAEGGHRQNGLSLGGDWGGL